MHQRVDNVENVITMVKQTRKRRRKFEKIFVVWKSGKRKMKRLVCHKWQFVFYVLFLNSQLTPNGGDDERKHIKFMSR